MQNKKTDIVFFYTCEMCDEHWIDKPDSIMCDESELDISTVIEDDESITKFIDAYGVCGCCEMDETDYYYWDDEEDSEE